MTTISKQNFANQNAGKSIDLDKLSRNDAAKAQAEQGGLTVDQLRRADTNRDGKLDTDEAFKVADNFDRDGNANTLVAVDRAGQATPAGKAVNALGLLMQNRDVQGQAGSTPPPRTRSNDDVLFVGMNPPTRESAGAPYEAQQLRNAGANLSSVLPGKEADHIKVGGRDYDLNDDGQRLGFARTLGLPADQTQKIADAIGAGNSNAKDELAGIAQQWAKGERGEHMPSRMVISGHNVGSGPWGDGNGQLSWTSLKGLAEAMPRAVGQIEDLNISACYSGGTSSQRTYKDIFPNLKTLWAYSGSAPGTGSGAVQHQAAWERSTRGDGTPESAAERLKDRGMRKAENIFTASGDNVVYQGPPISELQSAVRDGEPAFTRFFTGQDVVQSSQTGPLRDYYGTLQQLLQHPDLSHWQQEDVAHRRDQTIRTLFYGSNVAPRFAQTYRSDLAAGYRAVGMDVPDFAHLSRAEGRQAIEAYRDRLQQGGTSNAATERTLNLLNGLYNLDPQTIPETWI
ncbi:MAG: hypothetical protein ABIJ09_08845 [Pseudomonadota bacterium]